MTRRVMLLCLAICSLLAPAATSQAASWHSEQPVSPSGLPGPLGQIGDIEFWAPNRGALITAGIGTSPPGVYVYDGQSWRQYSTVCGGEEGRIAWAGPDEFWTIADQPAGQESSIQRIQHQVSLCHFQNGAVVASYAEPMRQSTSYGKMNAAYCRGPADCWFAGERPLTALNEGAFHLHWNGSTLTALPSLSVLEPELEDPPWTVVNLAEFHGSLFESVAITPTEAPVTGEPDPSQPSRIHVIEPGVPQPFRLLSSQSQLSFGSSNQTNLGPFYLAPSGQRLLGVAGAREYASEAEVTLVNVSASGYTQIPLVDPQHKLQSGDAVHGAAAEPGSDRVWVSVETPRTHNGGPGITEVVRVAADGTVEEPILMPEGEGAQRGLSGPITCPAAEQCWLATNKGWLFHLGGALPVDADPYLQGLITYRPPDDSIPVIPPAQLPIDDSGAEPATPAREELPLVEPLPHHHKAGKIVVGVHQSVVHKTVLQLKFVLKARAHVQLLARRHKHTVAKTPRLTLPKGRQTIRLRLDPKRWPTSLDFEVHPAKGHAPE